MQEPNQRNTLVRYRAYKAVISNARRELEPEIHALQQQMGHWQRRAPNDMHTVIKIIMITAAYEHDTTTDASRGLICATVKLQRVYSPHTGKPKSVSFLNDVCDMKEKLFTTGT